MLGTLFQLTRIKVTGASALYPAGIDWQVQPGVNVIVGGTGLGKTTLLNTMLFGLLGTFGTTNEHLAKIDPTYFDGRLSTAAPLERPTTEVSARVGDSSLKVTRDVGSGRALAASDNGSSFAPGEVKRWMCERMGLTDFEQHLVRLADCLLYASEHRYLLAWDSQAQNEVLDLLFYDPAHFDQLAAHWRAAKTADSRSRNLRTEAFNLGKDVEVLVGVGPGEARRVEEERAALREEREALERQCTELSAKIAALSLDIHSLSEEVASKRERFEELASDVSARSAIDERALVASLLTTPDQNSLYAAIRDFVRSFKKRPCPCCTQQPDEPTPVIEAVGRALDNASCPVCGLNLSPVTQPPEGPEPEEDTAELDALSDSLVDLVGNAEATKSRRARQEEQLRSLTSLALSAREKEWAFTVANPPGVGNVIAIKTEALNATKRDQKELEHQRDQELERFRAAQEGLAQHLLSFYDRLTEGFARYCQLFLDEACTVEFDRDGLNAKRPGPGIQPIHAAFFPVVNGVRRPRPDTLSEAQRLFVDLALRMAILDLWAGESAARATLLIEAPEGSVDVAYMVRVARMLSEFANRGHTLIITTNVNNRTFLPTLLEATPHAERKDRILNLLDLGNPRPVQRTHRKEFDEIINEALEEGGVV